jgi:hypothetical protein
MTIGPSSRDEVLIVPSAQEPTVVADYVQDWFDADRRRSALRLIVDGADRGVLGRGAAYELVESLNRGGIGAGDHASLAGYSVGFTPMTLCCPIGGCQVRAAVVSYDADEPPHCPLHQASTLRVCD